MDSGIIFALVLSAFFLGGIGWLIVHANRQERLHKESEALTSSRQTHNRAA